MLGQYVKEKALYIVSTVGLGPCTDLWNNDQILNKLQLILK